ncbi:hypothetical protein ACFC6L_05635 [Kitasatospora phosalacinea]|uniref:hypothetical protein n=1 Tax=Kitasatospora phosalacinea TaxID=2065 RepID=UPI0035D8D27E
MNAWQALTGLSTVCAPTVCPLTTLRRRLSPALLVPPLTGTLATAATVALLHPPARGATGFGPAFGAGRVTWPWGEEAAADQRARAERGLPPLPRGDAHARARFDPLRVHRYRRRMRTAPLERTPR